VDLSAVRQDDVEIAGADGRNWAGISRRLPDGKISGMVVEICCLKFEIAELRFELFEFVMPGHRGLPCADRVNLSAMPGIHVFTAAKKDVDGRDEARP
jgi:hypothetical protein